MGSDFRAITASLTSSCSTGTPNRSEASSSRTRRASAATRRIGQPSLCIASDPPDPPWSGVTSVLPMTRLVLVVGDIELVGHHLPKCRSRALTTVRLSHVERRCVVGMNRDPRIELP